MPSPMFVPFPIGTSASRGLPTNWSAVTGILPIWSFLFAFSDEFLRICQDNYNFDDLLPYS
jgi:hypothetical protein